MTRQHSLCFCLLLLVASIATGCQSDGEKKPPLPKEPDDETEVIDDETEVIEELVKIEIQSPVSSIPAGLGTRLTAIGSYNTGKEEDLTSEVRWKSDAAEIARVGSGATAGGLLTAAGVGTTVVHAELDGIEGSLSITVTEAIVQSVSVTPPLVSIPSDVDSLFFEAYATYSDGRVSHVTEEADWKNSNPAVGTIGNVSYQEWVEAEQAGEVLEYRAKGYFSTLEGTEKGTATITATLGGMTATATVVVYDATLEKVMVPYREPILLNKSARLEAYGTYTSGLFQRLDENVTWTSSDPSIISFSTDPDEAGLATAHADGSVTVTACVDTVCGSEILEVNARVLTGVSIIADMTDILVGTTARLKAIAEFGDGLRQDITAFSDWEFSGSHLVSIDDSEVGSLLSVFTGSFARAYMVRGVAEGALGVSVTIPTGPNTTLTEERIFAVRAPHLISLTIAPTEDIVVPKLGHRQLHAIGTFEDGSIRHLGDSVLWQVDDGTIASIGGVGDASGTLVGLSVGQATVTASVASVSDVIDIEVVDEIADFELSAVDAASGAPLAGPFYVGTLVQFRGHATLESGDVQEIPLDGFTWDIPTVGGKAPMTLLGNGLFQVQRPSSITISGTKTLADGTQIADSFAFESIEDTITKLHIDPPNPAAFAPPTNQQNPLKNQYFKIYAEYHSGERVDVTAEALDVTVESIKVTYGNHPKAVATPGEVIETTSGELLAEDIGFSTEPNRFPALPEGEALDLRGVPVTVRRFKAAQDAGGDYKVTFKYQGISASAEMHLHPGVISIRYNPPDPAVFSSQSSDPPPTIVVSTMDDLLIKDVTPKYHAALRMMETRAAARADSFSMSEIEAGVEEFEALGILSKQAAKDFRDAVEDQAANQRVRARYGLVQEFLELVAKTNRTSQEEVAVEWLRHSVHHLAVASATAALDEYKKWKSDPWSYEPPVGVDYIHPLDSSSVMWLFTSPQPPDLVSAANAGIFPTLADQIVEANWVTAIVGGSIASALLAGSVGAVLGKGSVAGIGFICKSIIPFIAQGAATSATAKSIALAGPLAAAAFAIVGSAIELNRITENEKLPGKLQALVDETKAKPIPEASSLLESLEDIKRTMLAVILRTYQ